MRSQLGEIFRTLDLTGQVVARSDTSAVVNFGQLGFLSVMTQCEGSCECLMTLALPRSTLENSDIEEIKHDVLRFFDMRPDIRCCVRTCEPVQLANAPFYAPLVGSPYSSVYAGPPQDAANKASPPRDKIYSVPKRYDLASMFSISVAYAMLFALMRALGSPPALIFLVGGFFTVVGVSQALLFNGDRPREASIISGTVYGFCGTIVFAIVEDVNLARSIPAAFCSLFWIPFVSYFAGTAIGGIWLIADYLRQWMEGRQRDGIEAVGPDPSAEGDQPPVETP